ncbi:hypothetical protein [Bdellovibrio svalbardensis]|uniref:Uncharacterized protein n=1 Tax=Bdellovibrio svalbardensis TaxID=2972972 RepID=A0ABT6DLX4_9BACT|nr:hypothetical protein [Bdellovibrio svalbardensis]MDG0816138.1 hypothetical protein [Bdellovibrio svalbardensis]
MNIAQHLVLPLLLLLGSSVNAQELGSPTDSSTVTQEVNSSATSTPQTAAQEVEDVPAPQRSLLKSAATKDFNKALYFDQIDNGLILPPLELDYELSANGKQLRVGNVTLTEKNFFFGLMPLGKTHSQLNQVVSAADAEKMVLVMAWPEKLLSSGNLEMISRTGAVLWRTKVSQANILSWNQKLEGWRKGLLSAGVPASNLRGGIFGAQYAILNTEAAGVFANANESFRFCLSFEEGRNQSKLCSQRYAVKNTDKGLVMSKVRADKATARILVNNEDAPLKQTSPVATDVPVGFYSELSTGESYEFVSIPNKLQLMDIADTSSDKTLRIVGYDTRPLGRSIILNPDQYTKLTKLLGFEATIGDPRKFWAAAVPTSDPRIYLPGQGGGVFQQRFELSEIPRRQSRVYLSKRTPSGTYVDGIELEGRKQATSEVSSTQNSIELDQKDPGHFYWKFQAKERGQINRSYLNVNFEGKTYKSYYEIYKGFPRELSARLSAVSASGTLIFLGELAYNQWFEDILGWSNYYVSRQRWGFAAKYFQSFNQLTVDKTTGKTAPLSVLNVDLKYRFTPGLWNRDETVGALASYQNVNFDQLKAPMIGVGGFWARSMPKVIDDIFNVVELMRYPKWVDMEFIYYVKSMDSNVTLNSSMSLNFHGKVLWTDSLFGEAGFGYKRYAFTDTALNQKAELNTFYGTVGLGLNF